jgi:altronate dehydratase
METKRDLIVIDEADNVGVAMRDIAAGEEVALPGTGSVVAIADVPEGHKVALVEIASGGEILKYGECIGNATRDIPAGDWVHTHNIE